jgi:hypothetical protein
LAAAVAVIVAVICRLASVDGQVIFRPVTEDDLSWLASLTNDPAAMARMSDMAGAILNGCGGPGLSRGCSAMTAGY